MLKAEPVAEREQKGGYHWFHPRPAHTQQAPWGGEAADRVARGHCFRRSREPPMSPASAETAAFRVTPPSPHVTPTVGLRGNFRGRSSGGTGRCQQQGRKLSQGGRDERDEHADSTGRRAAVGATDDSVATSRQASNPPFNNTQPPLPILFSLPPSPSN